jgi:hypothetical protein
MQRMRFCVLVVALALSGAACGSSTTSPTTTAAPPPHGEVTDPAGDVASDPRIGVSPDLIRATVDVASGNITFVVQYAPGTFNRQTTVASLVLDTDQDRTTGIAQPDGLGGDYSVVLTAATSQATITKADPASCAAKLTCFATVGSTPITVVSDGFQASIPLALLGGDDGRMSFVVTTYVNIAGSAIVTDVMPEYTLPAGRVQ